MATHVIYHAYYVAMGFWINQRLAEISNQCNISNSSQKLVLTKLKSTTTEQANKEAAVGRLLIHKARECAQVETLYFTQTMSPWSSQWEQFLKSINKCTRNPVLYKLLNWRKSVKNLSIEFFPQIVSMNDKIKYHYWGDTNYNGKDNLTEFGDVISNVFTRFDSVRDVSIYMKFTASYNNGYKLESRNVNESNNNNNESRTFTIDDLMQTVERYIEMYVNKVTAGIEQNYDKMKKREFCMGLEIFVGNMDIYNKNISNAVTLEHYLVEKKLIDETEISQTRGYIDDKQDIKHYGAKVQAGCDHVKKLIKHGNIEKSLYRSFMYSFMLRQSA